MRSAVESGAPVLQTVTGAPSTLSELVPLLWEINNLKRINAAHLPESVAAALFRRAWTNIAAGFGARETAIKTTADAVVAASLGAIDADVLQRAGLDQSEINRVLERAFESVAKSLDNNLRAELLQNALTDSVKADLNNNLLFVDKLAKQPRSGATKPGAAKLVFDAPESHAEHCLGVAVNAVLLAPLYQADIATVFLAALSHHFHNADLPDSGFAGEEMLGELLPKVFDNLREQVLREIPIYLHEPIRQTFAIIQTADTPEAKAFHAADVLDRVLQMRHHAEVNRFTLDYALNELELVHAGAVQTFHYEVLRQAGIVD